jgi:hypothetical protein
VTVYVDDMYKYPIGQFRRMKMSHMIADTDAELHAMADKIGVARKWHQAPPKHASHYDIAMSKRELAILHGAVAIEYRQLACMSTYRLLTGKPLPKPHEAVEVMANWKRKPQRQERRR